jgi:glycosyltransferase involved in cell wall biosynthesis
MNKLSAADQRTEPVLSILIPAYNYADGVRRIVMPLLFEGRTDIEILVHDDSTDDGVEAAMKELAASHNFLRYTRNVPPKGAVGNWNGLLQSAQGRYALLIHHDDFPLSENFASELLGELERKSWPDALFLSCLALDVVRKDINVCICNALRGYVARYWPSYLLRRNVLGPPSVLVVRREIFEGYDPNLKWLVDVEAYFRFLRGHSRHLAFSRLMMVSSTGMSNAISTLIKTGLKEITGSELAYLETKYKQRKSWLPLQWPTNYWGKLMFAMEWPLWAIFKSTSIICNAIRIDLVALRAMVNHRSGGSERVAEIDNTGEK